MKVVITGAGGMLGTDLANRLASKYALVGMGRRAAPHLKIPFRVGNLVRAEAARDLILPEKPDVILHAAAMTEVDRCEADRREALLCNFEATRHVADLANQLGALVIFFSTDFVFDGAKPGPYVEEDTPHPLNVYGETKLLAERYLLLRSKRFLILRTSWTFGERGDNFPKKILGQAEAGRPFPVLSDQVGSPTFTGDLAGAVGRIIEGLAARGRDFENRIYHLTNEGTVSRYEFARTILKKKNHPLNLILPVASDTLKLAAERPKNSALSAEKIKRDLGIQLRPWEEALDAYLEEDPALAGTPRSS